MNLKSAPNDIKFVCHRFKKKSFGEVSATLLQKVKVLKDAAVYTGALERS